MTNSSSQDNNKSILFVCIGNICRSPACEAICRLMIQNFYDDVKIKISSSAIAQFHLNESPDFRIQNVCFKNGIDISNHRAKLIRKTDWFQYNFIVALDPHVFDVLQRMKPLDSNAKILLFNAPNGIVDPYYDGKMAFVKMFREIQMNMEKFLIENNIV